MKFPPVEKSYWPTPENMKQNAAVENSNDARWEAMDKTIYLEELEEIEQLKKFTFKGVSIVKNNAKDEYHIDVTGKSMPPNCGELLLRLVDMIEYAYEISWKRPICSIEKLERADLILSRSPKLDTTSKYHAQFLPNRAFYVASHQIIEDLKEGKLQKYLTKFQDAPSNQQQLKENAKININNWSNKYIEANEEQKTVVMNIVNGTAFPFSCAVFGQPGTGKSFCLIETINQIWKYFPERKILVCAQTNSVCDEITGKLLQLLPRQIFFRFYSKNELKKVRGIKKEVLEISNLHNEKENKFTVAEFNSFSIVITTLVASHRLCRAGIGAEHFNYILVDESASAPEIAALIPIVGLGIGEYGEIKANISLFGVPKQLGPVVQSQEANELGLGKDSQ